MLFVFLGKGVRGGLSDVNLHRGFQLTQPLIQKPQFSFYEVVKLLNLFLLKKTIFEKETLHFLIEKPLPLILVIN